MTTPRLQSTGEFRVSQGVTAAGSFPSLPTIGNWIIVMVTEMSAIGDPATVADNQTPPNIYVADARGGNGDISGSDFAIIFRAKVLASSGTFTITVTIPNGNPSTSFLVCQAFEYGGLEGPVPFDQKAVVGSLDIPATSVDCGPTPSTVKDLELVLGVIMMALHTTPGIITPAAGWDTLLSETDGVLYIPSLGQEKIVGGKGTQSQHWDFNASAGYSACVATYKIATRPSMIGGSP